MIYNYHHKQLSKNIGLNFTSSNSTLNDKRNNNQTIK